MAELNRSVVWLLILVLMFSWVVVAGVVLYWRKRRARAARRSPLNEDLLRAPGQYIHEQLDTVRENVDVWAMLIATSPLLVYALHLTQSYLFAAPESALRTTLSVVMAVSIVCFATWRLLKLAYRIEKLRIGLQAEIAVAQELDQLMRGGAVVFHDLPAEHFNIDHVVICSSGVYAVETKGRSKSRLQKGRDSARVEFDGKALKFPGWVETEPIAQAERQAQWLQKWLSSATGEPIPVTPVLVLPGWFIERTGRNRVRIFNGKSPGFLLRIKNEEPLSEQAIQRVAHQVEQRCRTVKRALSPDDS